MKKLKVISRVLVTSGKKILLVHNRGADFWSLPGGNWEYEYETIQACGIREVIEETGYSVILNRMLWMQEFRKSEKVYLEVIWHGVLVEDNAININNIVNHIDTDVDSEIEEVRWFTKTEMKSIKVLPCRVKRNIISKINTNNPFIGSFDI